MSAIAVPFENKDAWLKLRTHDITSTEISALYGLSPYKTEFELFHEKREGVVVKIQENERMKWGLRLESAIAHGVAEDNGWEIGKLDAYMRDSEARIGSSFDFEIKSLTQGPGILEIKNVDSLAYARNWIDDGDGNIEAPEHIELQIQHQMEVIGYEWCALVALVGGNTQKVIYRNRDKDIGLDIRSKSKAFWNRVEANRAPSADYTRDAEFIIKQLRSCADETLIMEADQALEDLIKQYQFVTKEAGDLDKIRDQYKAEILDKIGSASKVNTSIGTLSCSMTKDSPGTLITPEMIGTYYGGRKGYRAFRFNQKKEK